MLVERHTQSGSLRVCTAELVIRPRIPIPAADEGLGRAVSEMSLGVAGRPGADASTTQQPVRLLVFYDL